MRAAAERLRAIGLSNADIDAIDHRDLGGRVPMRSPIDGTVIERTITLGQAIERATDAFKIADLSHLWVNLDLYEKDLSRVRVGQEVEVRADAFPGEIFRGRVAYVVPVIDEATRTAKVRLEFENHEGRLSLGQLVTARIVGDGHRGVARGAGGSAQRRRARRGPPGRLRHRRRRGVPAARGRAGRARAASWSRSAPGSPRARSSPPTAPSC